jgi:putative transposase
VGIQALCPQPGTSERHPQHKVYPYLLRKVVISRANQVWALDTTYISMARGCRLSMDGKGAWRDNVFVERVDLRAYDGVSAAKMDIAQFIDWYNTERPHSSLDDQTPDQTYWARLPALQQAA